MGTWKEKNLTLQQRGPEIEMHFLLQGNSCATLNKIHYSAIWRTMVGEEINNFNGTIVDRMTIAQ